MDTQKTLKVLTITKVSYTDKKKDGSPLTDKQGKQYYRVGIQCQEYNSQWLNGFLYFNGKSMEGQTQELEVWEEEWQGKKQLKFGVPRKTEVKNSSNEDVIRKLTGLSITIDKLSFMTEEIFNYVKGREKNNDSK